MNQGSLSTFSAALPVDPLKKQQSPKKQIIRGQRHRTVKSPCSGLYINRATEAKVKNLFQEDCLNATKVK